MRRVLRAAMKEVGVERVAFVCGAYHAPALDPASFPAQARDNELLKGLPRTKVAATWAPWSSGRLAFSSGYGAGVTSPGWYQHLFDHWSREQDDDALATSWLVRVARELRGQQLDASTASIVEASRLATALAAVRGRPSVGLSELDDAAEVGAVRGVAGAAGPRARLAGRRSRARRRPGAGADGPARGGPRAPAAGGPAQARRDVADDRRGPAPGEPTGPLGAAAPAPAARRRLGHRGRRGRDDGHVQGGLGARVAPGARGGGHRGRPVRHDRRRRRCGQGHRHRGPLRRPRHARAAGLPVPARRPPRGAALGRRRARGAHGQAARRPRAARCRRTAGADDQVRRRPRRRRRRRRARAAGPGRAGPRSACPPRASASTTWPPRRSATASRALIAAWRCWTTRGCAAAGCPRSRPSRCATGCTARSPVASTGCCSTPAGSTRPTPRPG